eukprot:CAMPEP_0114500496 /NCGR_PEP_ID=MMETSP0109-20121206/7997_1 /TAXON_ID=29199 /ORGANISM="Chlorarachnion reptans, Strain CCCM449" /LENGTH=899 /DNA_ID=CAMNT_0001678165 /DNA_START=246 /DNA_END=2945 /DNA_ORIENTATION=-
MITITLAVAIIGLPMAIDASSGGSCAIDGGSGGSCENNAEAFEYVGCDPCTGAFLSSTEALVLVPEHPQLLRSSPLSTLTSGALDGLLQGEFGTIARRCSGMFKSAISTFNIDPKSERELGAINSPCAMNTWSGGERNLNCLKASVTSDTLEDQHRMHPLNYILASLLALSKAAEKLSSREHQSLHLILLVPNIVESNWEKLKDPDADFGHVERKIIKQIHVASKILLSTETSLTIVLNAESSENLFVNYLGDSSLDSQYANGKGHNPIVTLMAIDLKKQMRSNDGHGNFRTLQETVLRSGGRLRVLSANCVTGQQEPWKSACSDAVWTIGDNTRQFLPFTVESLIPWMGLEGGEEAHCSREAEPIPESEANSFLKAEAAAFPPSPQRHAEQDSKSFKDFQFRDDRMTPKPVQIIDWPILKRQIIEHEEGKRNKFSDNNLQSKILQRMLRLRSIASKEQDEDDFLEIDFDEADNVNITKMSLLLSQENVPVIIRNTNVINLNGSFNDWMGENYQRLEEALNDTLEGRTGKPPFFFWDDTQPLNQTRNWKFTFENTTFSAKDLVNRTLRQNTSTVSDMAYHLGELPEAIKEIIDPSPIFLSYKDKHRDDSANQFLWISSGGVVTHTHCDMDHNFFVQLHGEKRFLLYPPHTYEHLALFPRIHPLWHKSQFNSINQSSDSYAPLVSYRSDLEPGDILYVPPYWFHRVFSMTASLSITTWSLDYRHYERMDSIYRYEPKYLRFANPKARLYILRFYMDLLIQNIYGHSSTNDFFRGLLSNRFASGSIRNLFPQNSTTFEICQGKSEDSKVAIPLRRFIVEDTKLDANMVSSLFLEIAPEARDIMLLNYVEETAYHVVGLGVYAFFKYCFDGKQKYVFAEDATADLFQEIGSDEDEGNYDSSV